MKKQFYLLFLLFPSFLQAKCPDIHGSFTCVDPNGIIYEQTVDMNNEEPTKYIISEEGKESKTLITDYAERVDYISFDKRKFKRISRTHCAGKSIIYEYFITDEIEISMRGSSKINTTKDGYKQINKLVLPFDKVENSRDDCKKNN
jgi:hypothetical protein